MADEADISAEYQAALNAQAIAHHAARQTAVQPRHFCRECDCVIPWRRREAVQTDLCIDCANELERRR